jgi:hypothetical protein
MWWHHCPVDHLIQASLDLLERHEPEHPIVGHYDLTNANV